MLQKREPVSGTPAVRDGYPQVCQDDGVIRFDLFGKAQRAFRHIALTVRHRAPRKPEVRVDARQMFGDRCAKLRNGVPAPALRDEHVSESHVRLGIAWILFEDLAEGPFELRTP